MKKYEILKKIGVIIKELQDQYEYTEQNKEDVNDLELELFVANAHFLTDHIEILRKLNDQETKPLKEEQPAAAPKPIPEKRSASETKYFEPVVHPGAKEKKVAPVNFTEPEPVEEIAPVEEPAPEVNEPVKEEPAPEPTIRHELLLDELYNTEEEAEPKEEVLQELPEAESKAETPEPIAVAVAETIPEPEIIVPQQEVIKSPVIMEATEDDKPLLTINQMISAQIAASRFGEQELQPIRDLKSAINLNDKLLFVRDLFNGYSMAYSEAIEIINRFNKFEEADQFLKVNYYAKNNWESKQATADKFYSLLQRRFPA
jgi:hypothetical protein